MFLRIPTCPSILIQEKDRKRPTHLDHTPSMVSDSSGRVTVGDDPYSAAKIQRCNEWMIDNSDAAIAVWDGLAGRTADTLNYAEGSNSPVLVIDPRKELERRILSKKGGDGRTRK